MTIAFVENLKRIPDNLLEVQATVMGAGAVFLGVFAVLRFATSRLSTMDDLSRGSLGTQDELQRVWGLTKEVEGIIQRKIDAGAGPGPSVGRSEAAP